MKLLEYLQNHIVFMDGGTGTFLQANGLQPGELPERWNISHPDVVTTLHRLYFDAGSNIVCTNTFGANLLKYDRAELTAVIRAAVENARRAACESTRTSEKYVALDIGPLGRLLQPLGDLPFEDAVALYAETVRIGAACGVDLIYIETMSDSYDTKAALLAAKENCSLPVFVSNAYGADGKLMSGATPAAMIAMLEGMGADAVGVNCSLGPVQMKPVVEDYLKYASVPVLVKPNAGLPVERDGKTVYDITPAAFAEVVRDFAQAGVSLCGGCCGTTPAYISLVYEAAKNCKKVPVTDKNRVTVSSYTHAVFLDERPVVIGERINPTGKKAFKEALRNHDVNFILSEGLRQAEQNADILDVNVGLPEIDECKMLPDVTQALQGVIDLPLQIDTADAHAMESALRTYNGKAMINSVNGRADSMAAVFPAVKKYGGVVVCLTLDENGIPDTAAGRIAIAEKIIATAKAHGIAKKNLIFDTLTMAVSAAPQAAQVTLDAMQTIREKLGCRTVLGVSNISFGLPCRPVLTAAFLTAALERGLSAAIINPGCAEVMGAYLSHLVLHGFDHNCRRYTEQVPTLSPTAASNAAAPVQSSAAAPETLQYAVFNGLKDKAAALSAALLQTTAPLDIINGQIIPALDTIGRGFEAGTLFLPKLLMGAEAASAAFEPIRAAMVKTDAKGAAKAAFVLCTVQGDIHDIGKNIVKLLLENYGFNVIDLGRDVAPEVVVDTVIQYRAPLVGLSALMTTTVPAMERTIALLREKTPWVKTLVGGAVLTKEYADKIGADYYCKDAMETVRYALAETEKNEK